MFRRSRLEEVIVNVGLPKTGTTSIQWSLFNKVSNNVLLNEGYLYPRCWQANHSTPISTLFSASPEKLRGNVVKGLNKKAVELLVKRYRKDWRKEVITTSCNKMILSGEAVCNLDILSLEKFKRYMNRSFSENVRIVIYVRNPLRWAASLLQQRIKGVGDTRQQAYSFTKEQIVGVFRSRIEKLQEVFGESKVTVLPFERAIDHEFGVTGDFLREVGFPNVCLDRLKYVRSNESVSSIAIDIINYINFQLPLVVGGKLNPLRYQNDIQPLFKINGPSFDISLTEKEEIAGLCQHDIEWLNRKFGIDYSSAKFKEFSGDVFISEETVAEEIKGVLPELSEPLKVTVLEYLQG